MKELLTFFSVISWLLSRSSQLKLPVVADLPIELHNPGILESRWRRTETAQTWNWKKKQWKRVKIDASVKATMRVFKVIMKNLLKVRLRRRFFHRATFAATFRCDFKQRMSRGDCCQPPLFRTCSNFAQLLRKNLSVQIRCILRLSRRRHEIARKIARGKWPLFANHSKPTWST